MDIAEVTDRDSLRAYLDTLEGEAGLLTARRVAFRAAARMLPLALEFFLSDAAAKRDLTAVPVFGALSVSGVASQYPSPEIATYAAANATYVGNAAAATIAATATATAVTNAASANAVYATYAATNYAAAVWGTIRGDLETAAKDPFAKLLPLWPSGQEPADLKKLWEAARTQMQADTSTDWSFWILWYDRIRAGRDFHADEMARILNPLRREDWEKGPTHINPMFDDLLAVYRKEDAAAAGGEEIERRSPASVKAIRSQVIALKDFVESELDFLRGLNHVAPENEAEHLRVLEKLIALREIIDGMVKVFEEDANGSTALVVVEENLPAIAEKAEELADLESEPRISAPIISMTATIKYMTDNGTPGHLAYGTAAADLGLRFIKKKWNDRKSKSKKETTALTRFPAKGRKQ